MKKICLFSETSVMLIWFHQIFTKVYKVAICHLQLWNFSIIIFHFHAKSSLKNARKMFKTFMTIQSFDFNKKLFGAKCKSWSIETRQNIFKRRQNEKNWNMICNVYYYSIVLNFSSWFFSKLFNSNTTRFASTVFGKQITHIM